MGTQGAKDRARVTVGTVAREAIRKGLTNEQALAKVKAKFPKSDTTASSIAWYRNRMRQDGEDVPTARQTKRMKRRKA